MLMKQSRLPSVTSQYTPSRRSSSLGTRTGKSSPPELNHGKLQNKEYVELKKRPQLYRTPQRKQCEKVLSDLISSHRASQMPDQVFGSHLILEEERRRFRATVENLEKQRAEAQEEVDDLINALRRERDLGDEEIIFLKAQLRGISATKYEAEDKAENLEKENEQLKEELNKERYKRKKLKERFLELQDLVNDESVVLVKEVEKRDEEIEVLKEDIADLQDQVAAAEEERDKAKDKEERLLEECEKLNQAVDELEDQLKASQRDIVAYRTYLEEKGVNTDDVFDDAVIKAKTDLEDALRDKKDLEAQLDELKQAVEDSEKELLEDIEAKEKKIQQLKRALDDNEYLHQTKYDDLFLDNEKLKEDIENLKEQLQEQLNNPTEELPELGVSQEKYDQLLSEMEKERQERLKLQNHYRDLKSYVDKDTSDLIAEVQERDAVIESMNEKLNDLDNLDQLEAELDWERKNRKIHEQKNAELRLAISQDKKDIVADSEKKSDMIRQLKDTLTDAKTNLERARYKQREIIANNQRLRADNQALQKEIDELKEKGVPGAPVDKKVEDLIDELKDCNRDLEKERELRGQLHQNFQDLKNTLSDEDADLADEIYKRDVIIANLHAQLREETDRLEHQLNNHRKREEEILDDYQTLKDKIDNVERDCEPIGHQPAIKDLERDMFEDLTRWQEDEVRILDTALNDRTSQLSDLEELLRSSEPGFDEERIHYVKELAAQERENNELRALNRKMEKTQTERAKQYEKKLDTLNKELEALRRRQGNAITSEPIHGSNESIPIAVMDTFGLEESGLGVSVEVDSFDLQRATPPGQAAPSPALIHTEPEKYDDSKERELVGQLRQIYSNLDLCRQDINRIVESFHDRIVRHHPRLQRTDSPTRLDARNIGATINSLLEGYHTQVTDLINRLNADSSAIARRNENLDEVVQQLESNLGQERARYDQLHARCKSYRQEIQDLRNRLKEGNIPQPTPMEGEHANHDLCQAVHELLNDIDSGPSTAEGRVRAPSIQEISRLLLPVAEQSQVPNVYSTPDGAAFKEDCDVIQEKTDELTDLVKGLHSRLDAQKQAKIDALQDKVKEYEKEMDRLRDLIGEESEKENELENLRERNRQLALNLRDSQADLEGAERKNSILTDKFKEANDALSTATDELQELRRKTREREAYIRQLQVETKFVEKSRQYTILEKDLTKLKDDHKVITEFCDKKNIKIDELEHDLRDLIKENQKLVDENAELTDETQVKDEKIKELENRLDAKEKLIDELEKAAGKMADDITARDNVLQTMNDAVEKLEKELDEKDELMKQLEDDLEQQEQDLEKIEQELQDAKQDLKEKEDEVEKLEDDKKNLEDEKDQLEDENKKLEDDVNTLEDKNKELDDLINKLEDMINNLKDDVEKLDKEVQDKDDVIKDLQDQLEDLKKQLEDAKAEDEKAKDLLDDLEKELEDKQKELDDTRNELDKANDELDELKPELERLTDEVQKLEDEVKDLEDTLKEERDATDAIKEENDAIKDEADKLKDTVEEQKEDLDNLSKIVDDLEKDIEEAENDNKELTDENEELKKNIEDLAQQKQDILDEVQEAMKDMDGERADYKDNLKELKDYLKAQQDAMEDLKSEIKEKPVMENRCMQTDVNETRSVKQQTDEQETMNVMIQTVIEEMKPPVRNRRVQTDVDALVVAAKSTAKTETRKSSSLHIIKALMTTIDRPTQTVDLQF
ncbi:hypothetical protein ACHWQZ_G016293 [Mnemiopsis leidyi]